MQIHVNAVGLYAPGLNGWKESQAILSGRSLYPAAASLPALKRIPLPRNEARRASFTIRLALQVAQEAMTGSVLSAADCCSVFSCSGGNSEATDKILTALALPERPVSPNHFTNSVHNAPAGYWSIATGSSQPSTSIAAYDTSFSAALLEAASLAILAYCPVLLVAYDVPPPPAIFPYRSLRGPFGVALLLSPERCRESCSRLQLGLVHEMEEDRMTDPDLESLRANNPAARSLPLLKSIAERRPGELVLPYLGDLQLQVYQKPC